MLGMPQPTKMRLGGRLYLYRAKSNSQVKSDMGIKDVRQHAKILQVCLTLKKQTISG